MNIKEKIKKHLTYFRVGNQILNYYFERFILAFTPKWFTFVGWLLILGGLSYVSINTDSVLIDALFNISFLFIIFYLAVSFFKLIQSKSSSLQGIIVIFFFILFFKYFIPHLTTVIKQLGVTVDKKTSASLFESQADKEATNTIPTSESAISPTDYRVLENDYRPARFRTPEAAIIKKVIPSGAFLRDFALLEDENAFLVLYVLNLQLSSEEAVMDYSPEKDYGFPMWCGARDFGQTIYGKYKLALVRDGQIINELDIPFYDFENGSDSTLINDPNGVWKNEGALMFRHARCILEDNVCSGSGMDFLETRQLQLTDLTGDSLPHEVRFMTEYIACGNRHYVIVGYDKKTDRVVIYNIIDEDGIYPTYDDFEPRADGTVIHNTGCDHSATRYKITKFRFNAERKAYVAYDSAGFKSCGE